ncbi:MAG: polysaccharide pyruvyl transferase family protein [Anaerolineae bacterium]|jgi:colanic acid/amylovoran biosynthesis protein
MNILILNVHSALNLGDEGIMHETLRRLAAEYRDATVTIAANDPDSWRQYGRAYVVDSMLAWVISQEYDGWSWRKSRALVSLVLLLVAAAAYRVLSLRLLFGDSRQRDLLNAYYDADLVLSCGGGNFYAHRPMSPSFFWSLLTLAFARFLDKKVVLLPQSFGPIEGPIQRFLARLTFEGVSSILARERRSQAFLKELGVRLPAAVVPDLAFGLASSRVDRSRSRREFHSALRVGVTVIDRADQNKGFARQQAYEDILTSVLVNLSAERGAHIYFFVQCYGPTRDQDDRLSTTRVYERVLRQTGQAYLLDSFESAAEIRQDYGDMDCVIASRMHAGVFALSTAVPVVMIAYQPKAYGVMEMFGLDHYCCSIETVRRDQLSKVVCKALDKRQQLRVQIERHLEDVRQSLQGWTGHLAQ